MPRYYDNREQQNNGDHEVHVDTCGFLPSNRIDLGIHSTCQEAVKKAKTYYAQSNGCYWCSRPCHTS